MKKEKIKNKEKINETNKMLPSEWAIQEQMNHEHYTYFDKKGIMTLEEFRNIEV